MSRTLKSWLLVLLILIAFGRGLWALGEKSLWWDESLSLHRATGPLTQLITNKIILTDNINTVDTIDNHPPFYFALLWVTVRLFGQSEFALRFLSVLAVVLAVPLLYATGKRLVDDWAGLAAAALAALSPMYLWYGQEARMYGLLAFLSLLSFYFFLRAFYHPSEPLQVRRHWPWIVAYALVSLAGLFTHYLASLLIAFQLLALAVILVRQTENRRSILLIMLTIALVSLPAVIYALLTLPIGDKQPGFYQIPLADLLRDLLNSFSLGLSVDIDDWYVQLIDLVFLAFMVAGLFWLVRPGGPSKRRGAGWLLAGYLMVPIAAIFLLSYIRPAYMNSRHLILITPAFYLLVGVGLTRWRSKVAILAMVGALVMLIGLGISTWDYFNDPTYNKDNHREWGAYLREHVRPGDVVIIEPPHIAELYEYYGDSGEPWVGLPLLDSSTEKTYNMLEELLRRYDRVWLAVSRTPPWGDRGRRPLKWLDANAFRADHKPVHSYASSVFVAAYLRDWPSVSRLTGNAQPLEVRYSSALRLMGYRLLSEPQPGKRLHVELFWQVDEPIPEEASIVLRLVDDRGHVWGQGEQCPFNGLYPMWQWQPGLLIPVEHELPIDPGTPPGAYELELVLVSRPSEDGCLGPPGEQIPPQSAPAHANRGDRVLLGTVAIEPQEEPVTWDELAATRSHNTSFGGLELLGSDLVPTQLKAGEQWSVALYWQTSQGSLPDARFRLRLVDSSGSIVQEKTIRPAGYTYPTDRWQAGDQFKGQFTLRLPEDAPGGRHQVEIVPEPPLEQSGLGPSLRRRLGLGEPSVKLGHLDVEVRPPEQIGPATPIPVPTESPASQPMLATFGDKVRFLGYDLSDKPVRAGDAFSFTLYWQALRPMDISYSVFTHLLGPSDQVLGQMDGVPQSGAYPTTRWQPGEIIVDTYTITVNPDAPPGDHPLEIGIYRFETGERMPITNQDGDLLPGDRILLPETTVLPALTPTPVDRSSWQWIYLPLIEGGQEPLDLGP